MEFVATEHFWMSGMYWGLSAMYLLGRLHEMDKDAILAWVKRCQHDCGGFGGSERNDPHILYTLSAVQILALYDRLDDVDADRVASCEQLLCVVRARGKRWRTQWPEGWWRVQGGDPATAAAPPGKATGSGTQVSDRGCV